MNLFKKQKFSIRKFNIGIYSTIIGTTLFLSQTHQVLADENEINAINNTPNTELTGETNTNDITTVNQNNALNNQVDNPTESQTANNTTSNQQNVNDVPGNETITETNSNPNEELVVDAPTNNSLDYSNNNSTQLQLDNINNHITLPENLVNDESQQHKPLLVTETKPKADRPKKRNRRAAVDNTAGGGTANTTTNNVTDPNINNIGAGSLKEILTFDDNGISPSTNRSNPTVTVVSQLPGYNLINGGKVGLISQNLVRTNMFNQRDPNNSQA